MAKNFNERRSLLILWLLLTTNSDIFGGQGDSGIAKALKKVKPIKGIDEMKQQIVTEALSPGYRDEFVKIRTLYQKYSRPGGGGGPWPVQGGGGPDHPSLDELVRTYFVKPVVPKRKKATKRKSK